MRTAQFVHIGDVHQKSTSARNAAKLQALDQIVSEGLQLPHLAAWLVPGDLFDTRSTVDDRNAWAARLTAMVAAAPVAICYGNHDAPGDLDIFGKLRGEWGVYVWAGPDVFRLPLATGDIASLAVLPYPTKAGLVADGIAKGDVISLAAALLGDLFEMFSRRLSEGVAQGDIPVFMSHVNVAGSLTSSGQPQIGMEIEIDKVMLERLPDCYCALNHIHMPQPIGRGVYAGSIAPMSWGEIEAKFYNVVTYTNAGAGWTHVYEQRPIPSAPMYHVEGLLSREGFTWQVTKGPGGAVDVAPASWRGAEVRVRYRFAQSEKSVLSEAQVLAAFAEAARLEVEPIAVPDRALRSPEVAAARTLAEKLAAYLQMPALPPSLAEKLAALEHQDTVALLARMQDRLAGIEAGESMEAMVA